MMLFDWLNIIFPISIAVNGWSTSYFHTIYHIRLVIVVISIRDVCMFKHIIIYKYIYIYISHEIPVRILILSFIIPLVVASLKQPIIKSPFNFNIALFDVIINML